jgi:hypothetical protein
LQDFENFIACTRNPLAGSPGEIQLLAHGVRGRETLCRCPAG